MGPLEHMHESEGSVVRFLEHYPFKPPFTLCTQWPFPSTETPEILKPYEERNGQDDECKVQGGEIRRQEQLCSMETES